MAPSSRADRIRSRLTRHDRPRRGYAVRMRSSAKTRKRATLAQAHGLFNVVGGVWPIVHRRSFEAVTGPKVDYWLVRTVAGLMVANGIAQLAARGPGELAGARRVGLGTAAALGLIDLVYAPPGRISRVYLVDAAAEAGWVAAWLRS